MRSCGEAGPPSRLASWKSSYSVRPAQKAWSAIIGNWGRLGERDQKAILRQLKPPRGVQIIIDGEVVG